MEGIKKAVKPWKRWTEDVGRVSEDNGSKN
jgi:hypothetical protein